MPKPHEQSSFWHRNYEIFKNKLIAKPRKHGGGYYGTHDGAGRVFPELHDARTFVAANGYLGIIVKSSIE